MIPVFVFGSNLAGAHAGGAARVAVDQHGAIMGLGVGLQGGSYAIPTMDCHMQTLPLRTIALYVEQFKSFADECFDETFHVTQIGCGIAGHRPEHIAPLFIGSPENCRFDEAWKPWLGHNYSYWGTHP